MIETLAPHKGVRVCVGGVDTACLPSHVETLLVCHRYNRTLDGCHLTHRSACAGTPLHHVRSSHAALLLLRDRLH